MGPLDPFAQRALVMGPLALPIWVAELVPLLRAKPGDPDRLLAAILPALAGIPIANGTSRPDDLALAGIGAKSRVSSATDEPAFCPTGTE